MPTILPEPVDGDDMIVSSKPAPIPKKRRSNKNTLWFMLSLVIVAVLCLMAAFFYDYAHNRAQDNTRKQDLAYIASIVNDYNNLNRFYPTLAQLNSSTFSAFTPNIDRAKFSVPDSTSDKLVAYPSDGSYAYQPLPMNCNNVTMNCTSYKLIAVLNDGSEYVVSSEHSK